MKRLLFIFATCITINCFAQTTTTDSITLNAQKLSKLLDSVHLDKYWLKGYNVDWLTGASISKGGATHCSAFAASFADKLGVYFLRPPQHVQTLLANAQCKWLATDSAKGLGWTKVATQLEAQNLANKGYLVLVGYQNPSPNSSGHMAVLRPYIKTLTLLQQEGPQEAQSGDINSNNIAVKNGFSSHPLAFPNGVIYYQHAVNWDSLFADINGRVITPDGTRIPKVRLGVSGTSLTGSMLDNTISTSTGYTLSEIVGQNYTIRPSKNDVNKLNGVSLADALLIQAHILGKTLLNSPYKLIAADVDGSGAITTLDILYLKRFILGIDTAFKGNRLWAFVDSNYIFPNPANPFPFKDSISIYGLNKTTKYNPTFIGVKLGDVNYDLNPVLFGTKYSNIKPLSIYFDNAKTEGQSTIRIPVKVKDFSNLKGFQYTIGFNPDALDFVGIENKQLGVEYATNHISEGKIPVLWMNNIVEGKTLEDDAVIMELVFDKKGIQNNPEFNISSSLIAAAAWDANMNKIAILKKGVATNNINGVENFTVSPNPSNGSIQVKWQLNNNKQVLVQLFNSTGKLLVQQTINTTSNGISTVDLQQKVKFPSGTYYLKAVGLNSNNVKQVVIK